VEVASFGVAGWLVQWLTAPLAVVVDAVSFVISAFCLGAIRRPEPRTASPANEQTTWTAMREGLHLVLRDPVLRALAGARGTESFFVYMWVSMLLVFLARDLALEPAVFGMLFAVGGVCSFVGALLADRVQRWLGLGPTLIVTLFVTSASLLLVPLAGGSFVQVILLVGGQQVADLAATIYQIHQSSLVQALVPDHSLGRVTASLRVIGWVAMLAGTVVGGVLGEWLGPRETMLIGALGSLPAALWLVWSPVRSLRTQPSAS
jgi:predicted MFS family arabinose efflux permease